MIFFKRRRDIIARNRANNEGLIGRIELLIKFMNDKYRHYNLNEYTSELQGYYVQLFKSSDIKLFFKQEDIVKLETSRETIRQRVIVMKSNLTMFDQINEDNIEIFDRKRNFAGLCYGLDQSSNVYPQQKLLIKKLEEDYADLDAELENVQKTAKFSSFINDEVFRIIKEKLKSIQDRLKIIDIKEQYVFKDFEYDI